MRPENTTEHVYCSKETINKSVETSEQLFYLMPYAFPAAEATEEFIAKSLLSVMDDSLGNKARS